MVSWLGQLTAPSTTALAVRSNVPSPRIQGPFPAGPPPGNVVLHDHPEPTTALVDTLPSPIGKRVRSTTVCIRAWAPPQVAAARKAAASSAPARTRDRRTTGRLPGMRLVASASSRVACYVLAVAST